MMVSKLPDRKRNLLWNPLKAFQRLVLWLKNSLMISKCLHQAVFETAVENQVDAIRDELYEEFEEKLEEEKEDLALPNLTSISPTSLKTG